jgi:hypothetical protein
VSLATSTDPPPRPRKQLWLVHDGGQQGSQQGSRADGLTHTQAVPRDEPAHVLVAGGASSARARMLGELRNLLPESTRYMEARETWEVLARAPSSRMVVLTDDLGDVSTESIVRLLGRRHPTLPVLTVGDRPRAGGRTYVETARP